MKLTIRNLQYGDFGNYRCISKNSLGETEGSIRVYGKCICIGSLSAAVATSKHPHTQTYTHTDTLTRTHTPAHTVSNAISSVLCATILPKAFTYVPHQRPQRGNGEEAARRAARLAAICALGALHWSVKLNERPRVRTVCLGSLVLA